MDSATTLHAFLFGTPHIQLGEERLSLPRLRTRALFYRLAAHLQPVARDHLCFLFWPDVPDVTARRNLTLLLSHLRRALPAPEMLIASPADVRLDATQVCSDSARFAQLCTGQHDHPSLDDLAAAVSLYRGPLLAGFGVPECLEFELWLTQERRSFEGAYLDALTTLLDASTARGHIAEAIAYARRYLEVDALAEEVHRQLMRLYALTGERAAAQQQFELCAAVLEQELGVSPLPETAALYHAIRSGELAPQPAAVAEPTWTTLAGPDVPLVGRQSLWQQMQTAYEQAADGQGSMVLLAGEAGIGKSRLMQEFATRLPRAVRVLSAASHPGVQSIPYQPLVEALRPALQDHIGLAGVAESWLSVASLLFPELRTLFPNLPPPVLPDPEQARGQLFEALCQILRSLSRDTLVLLCLDDLHWADSTTLDWLSYLARSLRHSRLLLLGAYRSEEAATLVAWREQLSRLHVMAEIYLTPLGLDEVRQVLAHVYPADSATARLATRLQQITGGNPFFLLESVQALLETRATLEPATLAAETDLPISPTVREMIGRRMETLQPMARQVLEAGAVLGPEFAFDLVRQTAGRHELETMEGLDELVTRRFLAEQDDGFRFRHELIQAVVYQTLSHWRRQLLHRRAGEILERLHPDSFDPASGQIAAHYARGGLAERAISFYQRAADIAERVYAIREATQYLNQALTLLQTLPDSAGRRTIELDLLIAFGSALTALKGFSAPEIKEIYTHALNLCDQVGNASQRFQVIWGLQSYYQVHAADFAQAHVLAKELLKFAQDEQESLLLSYAYFHLGTTLLQQGELVQAQTYFQQAIDLYDPHQSHPYVAHTRPDNGLFAHCFAAHTLWHLGYADQALAHSQQALAIADELARPFDQVVTFVYASMLHQFRHEREATYELAQAAAALCTEYSFPYYLAWATILLGWAQVEMGEFEEGVAQLRRGLADFDRTGAGIRKPYYLGLLAEALGKAGKTDEGLAVIDNALTLASTTGNDLPKAELVRLRGELLLAQGAMSEAAEHQYWQAIEIARRQGAKSFELRAVMSLCRLWQEQGREQQAHELLAEIYAWFSEGFDTPDLIQAQALLQELAL